MLLGTTSARLLWISWRCRLVAPFDLDATRRDDGGLLKVLGGWPCWLLLRIAFRLPWLGSAGGATGRRQPFTARRTGFGRCLFECFLVVGADVLVIDRPAFAHGVRWNDGDGMRLPLVDVVGPIVGALGAVDVSMIVDVRDIDSPRVAWAGAIARYVHFAWCQRKPADSRGGVVA